MILFDANYSVDILSNAHPNCVIFVTNCEKRNLSTSLKEHQPKKKGICNNSQCDG